MIKLSAALAIGVTIFITSGVALAKSDKPHKATACDYAAPDGKGGLDCFGNDTPDGRFMFTTWDRKGRVAKGYPLFTGTEYVWIKEPTTFELCRSAVSTAIANPDLAKFTKIQCVKVD
jgi:hypothetical protein